MTRLRDTWGRFIIYVDGHPRVGWYVALIAILDLLVDLLELFG